MREKLLKGFDFFAEGLCKELIFPAVKFVLVLFAITFLIMLIMLLIASLGIADYETMRNGLLEFSKKPWW